MIRTNRTLIGTREAAKVLGISQPRVRQLIAGGALWSEAVGTLRLVDLAQVEKLAESMASQRQAGTAKGPAPRGFRPG